MLPNGKPPTSLPPNSQVVISSNCVLNVSRIIGSTNTLSIDSGVDFTINSGNTLRIQGDLISGGNITNNGTFRNQGESTFSGTFINNGIVNAASAATYTMTNNGPFTNNGVFTIGSGLFVNSSTFTNIAGATLTINQGFFKNDGTLNNNANAIIQANSDGTILGNLNNDGTLSLSNGSIGTFTITGNYTSSSTSVIVLDIRENNNGNPVSDQLVVGGTATINGTLSLNINNSNFVYAGDPFNLLIAGSVTGTFATLDFPGIMADWQVTYDGNGLMLTYNGAPLPIELLSFIGKVQNEVILLKWETASEKENAYMAVERSRDGIHFQEIGQRKGAGTTFIRQAYNLIDTFPFFGVNYYRLRQVDADGKPTYHDIIAVEFGGKIKETMRLYPTQTSQDITIVAQTLSADAPTLQIFDTSGKLMQQKTWDTDATQQTVNVSALPSGTYFITLRSGKNLQTLRFMRL